MSVDPLNLWPSQRIEIGIRSATRGLWRSSWNASGSSKDEPPSRHYLPKGGKGGTPSVPITGVRALRDLLGAIFSRRDLLTRQLGRLPRIESQSSIFRHPPQVAELPFERPQFDVRP